LPSKDYQVVWASGEEPLLYGYVVSFGTLESVKIVKAFVYDSKKKTKVGASQEYMVRDFPSAGHLTQKIYDSLRKEGADAIIYFNEVFPVELAGQDLTLHLPFPSIRKVE